jgi:ribose 5-phosphate isomerase B
MKIHVGSDHAGFELKQILVTELQNGGFELMDHGTQSTESCDYPTYASLVCQAVQQNPSSDLGLLICGSGIGMSITANKFKGIRAALCCDSERAKLARQHNHANVLCLGARFTKSAEAIEIALAFVSTPVDGGESRHARRVQMIQALEAQK